MANNLGDMVVKIVGDNASLDSSIDKSKAKMENFGRSAEKVGKSLTKFVTLPILAIGAAAVKSAADMEMQEAAFTTLLGSAEAARDMLKSLTDLAAKTPFQLTDLADATKTMLAFGVAQEEVLPNLQMLGDIAQGNRDKLNSLTLAFSQIQSTGRLMGQDLLQLINAGFNPLKIISEQTGESMAELKKRMEQGAISAEEVAGAFKIATSEGGLFFGGMEKASQTLLGQFSTLKDNVIATARSFGEVLLPTLKDIVASISEWVERFTNLDEGTKRIIISVAGYAAVIGPLALTIGKVTLAVKALSLALMANPYILAIAGIVALGGAIFALTTNLRQEAQERKDLENKVEKGIELTSTERVRLSELNIERLKGIRLLRLRALEAAKTLNQGPAALQLIQDQINKIDGEIAVEALRIKSVYDGLAADRAAAAAKKEAELAALALTDATEGLTYEQEEYTEKTEEQTAAIDINTDAKNRNRTGGQKNKETVVEETEAIAEQTIMLQSQAATMLDLITDEERARANLAAVKKGIRDQDLAEEQAAAQEVADSWGEAYSMILSGARPVFDELGSSLVEGTFQWKDLGSAAINSIGQIISALGDQLAAEAAIDLVKAIAAAAGIVTAPLAPGYFSSAAIKGAGAAAAWATGAALSSVKLAEGGIVMPTPGGTVAQIAEAGQPEVVFPLDKLDSMLSGGGAGGGDIYLTVEMDSQPIFDKVFSATRDRRILIDARAVV